MFVQHLSLHNMSSLLYRKKNRLLTFNFSRNIDAFINAISTEKTISDNKEFEYDKHDDVITKAESEVRIIVLLSFTSIILSVGLLLSITRVVIMLAIDKESEIILYSYSRVQKKPYLHVLFNNGSNEVITFGNETIPIYNNYSFSQQDFYIKIPWMQGSKIEARVSR